MLGDEEVLSINNDLSRHMISEGFIDFESYNLPQGSSQYTKGKSSPTVSNNSNLETIHNVYISNQDYSMLSSLLKSKLLLPDDFELVEFLLTRTTTSNRQTKYTWLYSSSVILTTISVALYFGKKISFQIPTALISIVSILSLGCCYEHICRLSENRSFAAAIGTYQSLCLNVNKLFRLLKETEILSTGQVTTQNVGAALYIPVTSLKDPHMLPSWKTLPHLRKCLASTLFEVIDLLKSTCDDAKKVVPNWLFIDGYTFCNGSLLPDHLTIENLQRTDYYVSLKDLQVLNDSYLILQSELFRWVGFCICPSAWNPCDSSYKVNRDKILMLFCNAHLKLRLLSFKLKMHYDIKQIFTNEEALADQKSKKTGISEINNYQSELHNLYLLILSMLIHLKSLEDHLESNSTNVGNSDLSCLNENISVQLNNVRHKLTFAVNMFNTIYLHSFSNQNSGSFHIEKLDDENFKDDTTNSPIDYPAESVSQTDFNTNSFDEVFLAVTDITRDEQDKLKDNWDMKDKPIIPNSLLAELSNTLKPIKENFKEREKAALERAGLEDLNNESNSDIEVTDKDLLLNSPALTLAENKNNRKSKPRRKNYQHYNNKKIDDSESDSSLSTDEAVNHHTRAKGISIQSTSTLQEDFNKGFPISDRSIANMIAMKSQTWGLAEEEYYSDD